MNIACWLHQAGLDSPERTATRMGAAPYASYRQLARRSAGLATGLRGRHGLAAGDRVAIVAKNEPAYLEALFGAWWAGLVVVPVNAKLHPGEIEWIAADAGVSALIASAELAGPLGASPGGSVEPLVLGGEEYERLAEGDGLDRPISRGPDDLAWLFYTSGTTGRPKGAMLSHRNLEAMTLAHLTEVDPTVPSDCLVHAAPMSHGSGLYSMSHVCRRAANVFPESGGFDAEEVLGLSRRLDGVSMFAAPTMIQRLNDTTAAGETDAFRTLIWGGAPMHTSHVEAAVERFGGCLAQIYGQGESPMTIAYLSKEAIAAAYAEGRTDVLGSAGIPFSVVEVEARRGDGTTVDPGEEGEVAVRGATVMSGYWKDPEATAAALRDGWLHTGDIGTVDHSGLLTLKDRAKDLIISGGTNVYPREVEDVLLAHPGVRDVAVVGLPDDEWGEIIAAYVVADVSDEELDGYCLAEMARFKRPRRYLRRDSLPKSSTGKLLKRELRDIAPEH